MDRLVCADAETSSPATSSRRLETDSLLMDVVTLRDAPISLRGI